MKWGWEILGKSQRLFAKIITTISLPAANQPSEGRFAGLHEV